MTSQKYLSVGAVVLVVDSYVSHKRPDWLVLDYFGYSVGIQRVNPDVRWVVITVAYGDDDLGVTSSRFDGAVAGGE